MNGSYAAKPLSPMVDFDQITPEQWRDWEHKEIWTDRLLTKGYSGVYEKEYIRKDGVVFPVEIQAYAIFEQDGTAQHLWAVVRDITVRKQVTEALRQSEERFRQLVENIEEIIFVHDADYVLTYVSPQCERITGYTAEELIGQRWDAYATDSPTNQLALELLAQARESNVPPEPHQVEIRTKNGIVITLEVNDSVVRNAQGDIRGVIGSARDITHQLRMEKALRQSEERFRITVNQIPGTVWTIDTDLKFTLSRGAGLPALGLKPGQVVGMSLFEFFRTDDPNYCSIAMHRRALGGESLCYDDGFDDKHYQTFLEPIRSSEGDITGVVGISFDITDKKRTGQRLQDYQRRLKKLTTELTLAEERQNQRLAEALHDGVGQSLAFTKMKIQMLEAKTESESLSAEMEGLCQVVDDTIEEVRSLSFGLNSPGLKNLGFERAVANWLGDQVRARHGIKTEFEDDGRDKGLSLDEQTILFRCIRELVTNVIKHAQAQTIQVAICRQGDEVVIAIRDDGCGFDAAKTMADSQQQGFGLFSVQERLEQMQGGFVLDSAPGGGCLATLRVLVKSGPELGVSYHGHQDSHCG